MLKTVEGKQKKKNKTKTKTKTKKTPKNIPSWIVEHSLSGISKEIQSEDNHDRKEMY